MATKRQHTREKLKKANFVAQEAKEKQNSFKNIDAFPGLLENGEGFDSGSDSDWSDSEDSVFSGLEDEYDGESDGESGEFDEEDDDENGDESEGSSKEESASDQEGSIVDSLSDVASEESGSQRITDKGGVDKDSRDVVNNNNQNNGFEKDKLFKETSTPVQTVGVGDGEMATVKPSEYDYDSSDEEDIRNTVGNIPMEWYNEYPHLGYTIDGQKVIKPATGDELDKFLDKMENKDYWRTVHDKMTGRDIVLNDEELDIIRRIQQGLYPQPTTDPYEPWIDFFTHETMIHPVTRRPADKRSFIPSLWEKQKVAKYVHAIKMGWLRPSKKSQEEGEGRGDKYYMLWDNEDQAQLSRRYQQHIPAPKMALPGHEESYNPPPEYLPTPEEIQAWEEMDPEEKVGKFLPQKFDSLRKVPGYKNFIRERFDRCLDLYLCPRQKIMREQITAEELIPKLPKPRDLQPFPTTQALVYLGHKNMVRAISVHPTGQWLASGSDDKTVRVWEVSTGRCLKCLPVGGTVQSLAWCPNPALCLLGMAIASTVHLINPAIGDKLVRSNTDNLIDAFEAEDGEENKSSAVKWQVVEAEAEERQHGFRLALKHPLPVRQVTWHAKGDYFAAVLLQDSKSAVYIHQLTRRRSQNPFKKPKGLLQCVLFHPSRPFLFVATQRYVRIYNLLKQVLTKKLMTNSKWVSSMAVHPGGDNVITGSYDCRLSWFDTDLSTKPYQTLRHHKKAVRQVDFHRRYPLFASASDDGSLIICHGMVYSDLMENPLIVPVKILRGHNVTHDLGVLDCQFHPTQPWIFSSGADGTIRLYT